MKHLIIFNPAAGKANDGGAAFEQKIKESFEGLDYEIYKTTGPRAVVDFLKGYLKKNAKDTVRVYACGGDGTVNEAVNGMVDFDNAELAILPTGTGNDFVKIYGVTNENVEKYRDFKPLINAEPVEVEDAQLEP